MYKATYTSSDVYGIKGPGQGYYAWYLFPKNTFETWEEAEKVARMMNIAYHEGLRAKQQSIRQELGL